MLRIGIIGTGNVARQLFGVFRNTEDLAVVQIAGRSGTALKCFGDSVTTTTDFTKITDADIYMIAVSDDAIATISQFLRDKSGLVVHTSGSVAMDVLDGCKRHGVFYPLQTFSKEREIDMQHVPFCLEANSHSDLELLKTLALKISDAVYAVDSETRKTLHLAAVFVNNFTNHLYYIGQQLCEKEGLPFEILKPLIKETAEKINHLAPKDAQTGPARRGDVETIKKQLKQLDDSRHSEIYRAFSSAITELSG